MPLYDPNLGTTSDCRRDGGGGEGQVLTIVQLVVRICADFQAPFSLFVSILTW